MTHGVEASAAAVKLADADREFRSVALKQFKCLGLPTPTKSYSEAITARKVAEAEFDRLCLIEEQSQTRRRQNDFNIYYRGHP
jgi:hypothetical protein